MSLLRVKNTNEWKEKKNGSSEDRATSVLIDYKHLTWVQNVYACLSKRLVRVFDFPIEKEQRGKCRLQSVEFYTSVRYAVLGHSPFSPETRFLVLYVIPVSTKNEKGSAQYTLWTKYNNLCTRLKIVPFSNCITTTFENFYLTKYYFIHPPFCFLIVSSVCDKFWILSKYAITIAYDTNKLSMESTHYGKWAFPMKILGEF